ncbi:NADP(H)-dependent aldo-keto reductase [Aliamphritea hakodatensis]|uniref:NADP(H)-dependent aldo-keto reductase n=1 Tax=Aliamphritea hakodatensis TaxID=2895352 RepID=UPI0022FD99A7|nr:NADP(H)-dependent aldo-keto reductase [Aliamphritea hakodatensis]
MRYNLLGDSDLNVSRVCLGTMTYSQDNTEAEAFAQLDYAFERGVNFVDTAEIYPAPVNESLQGQTEVIIGRWMQQRGNRDKVILATKVAGPAEMTRFMRPDIHFDEANIRAAVEGSLERLQTDYIDLYQLHWPDRATNFFGQLNYTHAPQHDGTAMLDTLKVLKALVDEGKIRYIGLSNETPWGVMSFVKYAEILGLPKVVSVQNPYSLLNRSDEVGLTEVLLRENVPMLPYSPLGFGVLSGKYLDDQWPEGARLTLYKQFGRYIQPAGVAATRDYVSLARQHGWNPAQMALAYVDSRDFVASTIIGATQMPQLEANIDAFEMQLSAELSEQLEVLGKLHSNPCP